MDTFSDWVMPYSGARKAVVLAVVCCLIYCLIYCSIKIGRETKDGATRDTQFDPTLQLKLVLLKLVLLMLFQVCLLALIVLWHVIPIISGVCCRLCKCCCYKRPRDLKEIFEEKMEETRKARAAYLAHERIDKLTKDDRWEKSFVEDMDEKTNQALANPEEGNHSKKKD